jgi:predicted transcriptional regulator of viral defense system
MSKKPTDLSLLTADFESRPPQAYSHSHLAELQATHFRKWRFPSRMGTRAFIQLLLDQKKISQITLRSPEYSPVVRYVWKNHHISQLAIALSVRTSAYLSHATALWLHGLEGDQRHIFVNAEQSDKETDAAGLTQEAIHRALQNKPRQSRLVYSTPKVQITVINGKNTGDLEVQERTGPAGEHLRVTSLERTLIDIVVRPIYSGGVQAVLNAYRLARERASAPKMANILQELEALVNFSSA